MKPIKYALNKVVLVDWRDACTKGGWDYIGAYAKHAPSNIRTVGFLLKKTKKEILIATSQSEDGDINQSIAIPLPWVVRVVTLK